MRHRPRVNYSQLNKQHESEECSWNTIIVWAICISIVVLVILYLAFGPSLYHAAPILLGPETVSLLTDDKKLINVYESTVNINGNDIFYRYTEPRGKGKHTQPDVLILHGAKYGSQTWKGLGTLQIFSFWGYRTFAIDLPGYKLSKKATPPEPSIDNYNYIEFMNKLSNKLMLKKIVLIVPSMSGIYGLPILLQQSDVDLVGFIAIAPQGTPKYSRDQYEKVNTPTMMLWGEKDRTEFKEESLYWMSNIPNVESVMVPKGEHAAFVGNPEDFHKEILKFMVTNCKIGEDEDYGFEDDTTANDFYDDSDYFGGYNAYSDGDTDLYNNDDTGANYDSSMLYGNYEDILANYFDKDGGGGDDYYDDTELYFDNRFGEYDDLKDDTETEYNEAEDPNARI